MRRQYIIGFSVCVLAGLVWLGAERALAVNEVGDPNCSVVDVMQPNRLVDVDPGDRFWLTVPVASGLAGVEVHREGDKGWTWLKAGEFLPVQYAQPGEYTIRFRGARVRVLAPLTVRVFAPPADAPQPRGHNGQAGAGGVQALGATSGESFSLGSVYAGRYPQPGTANLTDKYPLRVVAEGPWSCTVWQYGGSWTNTYYPPAGTTGRWETADVVDVTNCVMWTLVKSCGGTQTLSTNNPSRLKVKDLILTNGPSYTPVGESVTNRTWGLMVGDVATVTVVPGPFWVTNNPVAAASVFEWTTNGAAYTPFTGLSNDLILGEGSNLVRVACHSPSTSPTNQETTVVGVGYVLSANKGDVNGNRIPDFADGYTGVAWGTNVVAGLQFVPVTIDLAGLANNSTITFSYAGSSPRSVSQNTSCSGATIYELPDDAGRLRLWTKDGYERRDGSEIANGGDFVRGDSNAVNQSSLLISNGQLTLYAEGLRESSNTVLQVTYTDTNNVQVVRTIQFKIYEVQVDLSPVGGTPVDPLMYPYHGLSEERVGRLQVKQPAAGLTAPITLQFVVTDDHGAPTNYPGMTLPVLRDPGGGTTVHDFNVSAVYSNVPPGSDLRVWVRDPVRGYFMAQQAGSCDFDSLAVLPEPQLPSLSLGSKYRRVNRQGIALPDPSPTGEGEDDRLPDQAHIDLFNLTPTYSVSDARVPVVGGELTLEFRRTATLTSHELGGDTVPPYASETILGPGWSTSLGSRITVAGDATDGGLVTATVVDDLGNAYRYQKLNGAWRADVRHSFNNDALRATLFEDNGQLVLRRAFGTKLHYTAVSSRPCASETYYRLEKIQDRNGNCLLYAYGAAVLGTTTTNALLVSSVTTSNGTTSPLSLSLAYTNTAAGVRLAKLTDPLGRVTTYDYASTGGDKLATVTYPAVAGGAPTVRFTYFDQSRVKTIYANNAPLYANNSQQIRWVGVATVTDARNGETTYTYAANFARMPIALRADGAVLSMDRPYLTSVTTADGTANFQWGTDNNATSIINTVTDTRQKQTVYTFTGAIMTDTNNLIGLALRINTVTRRHVHAGNATVTWTYSNDRYDNLTSVTDLSSNTISYAYAGDQNKQYNLPSSRTDALGHTTTYEYSATPDGSYNKQRKVTDAEGIVTEYQFDTHGNRTAASEGSGARTNTFAYDATGTLTNTVLLDLAGARVTDIAPDGFGNPLTQTAYTGYNRTGTALVTATTRDPLGKILSQTDPNGNLTTFAYDDLDRKTSETHPPIPGAPAGSTATFHYDLNGNLTKTVDDNGQITLKEYDPLNRPTRTILDMNRNGAADAGDLISITAYDPAGNVLSQTDPNGHTTTFQYDALLRLTKKTFPTVTVPGGERTFETYEYGPNAGSGAFTLAGFQPTRITNKRGHITDNYYDAAYRLTNTVRRAAGSGLAEPAVSSTYNRVHKKITETIANTDGTGPQTNSLVYDPLYRVTATTNALGFVTRQTYDKADNVLTVTDAEGHTTSNVYDAASRLLETRLPAVDVFDPVTNEVIPGHQPKMTYTYDANGNKLTETDPSGNRLGYVTKKFDYDARNRLVKTYVNINTNSVFGDGDDIVTETAYDLTTHVVRVKDGRGNETDTGYDNAYRVTSLTGPAVPDAANGGALTRPVTRSLYDNNGNVTHVIDPNGIVTKTDYDAWNRARYVTRALRWVNDAAVPTAETVTSQTQYDANGNVTALTLSNVVNSVAQPQTTTYAFDEFDRKTQETLPSPDGQIRRTLWTYYQNGTVASVTDAKNQRIESVYDRANRTVTNFYKRADSSLEETRTFAYNKLDKPLTVTDRHGQTTFTYAANDLWPISESRQTTSQPVYTVTSGYDANGNRARIIYPDTGRTVRQTFDAANRLAQVLDDPDGPGPQPVKTTAYTLDANGNTLQIQLPNGVLTTNVYDALNRALATGNLAGTNLIYGASYGFDLVGNRLTINETSTGAGGTNTTTRNLNYGYDAQYRLTNEAWTAKSYAYTFDLAGNRLQMTVTEPGATNVSSYAYDSLNRLLTNATASATTTYAYDLNGSRIEKSVATANTVTLTTYTFDVPNRLVAAGDGSNTTFEAAYDYRTRRLATTENGVSKYFRYDGGLSFQEITGGPTPTVDAEFVRGDDMGGGIGGILYRCSGTGLATTEHYSYSQVGHTVALTDNTGAVTKSDLYEAYGNVIASTGTSSNNRLANTKERSFTLGLDNHGMRYFDPEVGRYISADPIGYADGLNVYLYVHNNPINHIDPLGLWNLRQTFGLIKAVGGVLETAAGVSVAVAAGWTGIGAVGGGLVAAHGLDTIQSGLRQAFTGQNVDSLTSEGLQKVGVSQRNANLIDAGISVVGSLGAGLGNASTKIAAIAATDEAAGMTTMQILKAVDAGSKALPTSVYNALGGTATTALTKATQIAQGAVQGTEGIHLLQASKLALTGLTPAADLAAGVGGAVLTGAAGAEKYSEQKNETVERRGNTIQEPTTQRNTEDAPE